MSIVFPILNNPNWPLPADYETLTSEGAKLARVNAASMTAHSRTTDGKPATTIIDDPITLYVHSWRYFCNQYLRPDLESGFDPMWYEPPYYPEAAFHCQLVYWWNAYRLSGIGAPRGSAKSTTLRSYILQQLVVRQQYQINIFKAKESMVHEDFDRWKLQLTENSRIQDDFGVLKPKRNEGLWSNTNLRLTNMNRLRGYGIDSGKRGPRGNFNALDDVERDPKKTTLTDSVVEELKNTTLRVILPMLAPGCNMTVMGTIIHQRSFLANIISENVDASDMDPRLQSKLWFRINLPATSTDGRNTWSAKYTPKYLEEMRELLGDSLFGSEFEGDPCSSQDCILEVRPIHHEYQLDTPDLIDPFRSTSRLLFNRCTGPSGNVKSVACSEPYGEYLERMDRFIVVDPARSEAVDADWTCIHVWGVDSYNDLFSLDMMSLKTNKPFQIVQEIWRLTNLWRPSRIGVESFSIQMELVTSLQHSSEHLQGSLGYVPIIVPIQPTNQLTKGQKIQRAEWRFNMGKIKLPGFRRSSNPYSKLYHQIRRFTVDLSNLRHDDEIDTLGMTADMLRGGQRGNIIVVQNDTPMDRLLAGDTEDKDTGLPLSLFIDPNRITAQHISQLGQVARERAMRQISEYQEQQEILDGELVYSEGEFI
jgi:hypothetical protein